MLSDVVVLMLIFWAALLVTWIVGIAGVVLIIGKFRQHSDTMRHMQRAHSIQETYVNGMLERMTRPQNLRKVT